MAELEQSVWRASDVVLYPSDEEAGEVATLAPGVDARAVVPYAFDRFDVDDGPGERRGLMFVAGFGHPPNEDAARWLVTEVLPRVWSRLPELCVSLVGSNPTQVVRELAANRVEVTGYVTDAELARRYRAARVAVVPLRYGAGVKSKSVEAMQQGVPLVMTTIGAQGLDGVDAVASVADDPLALADAIVALVQDDALWSTRVRDASIWVAARFSTNAMRRSLLNAMGLGETA